jgi:outer membrane protein assembly factor BamB
MIGPLLVDSQAGRLYLPGWIGRTAQVFVLAADDARLLATYPISGSGHVGLDPVHRGLYVDGDEAGLAWLDTQTGALRTVAPLPAPTHMPVMASPQLDPTSGQVLVFRDNVVYRVDPDQGQVVGALTTTVRLVPGGDVLSIVGASYDADRGRLYLKYESSPAYHIYLGAVVAVDAATGQELGRQQIQQCTAFRMDMLVVGDTLYGVCWRRPTGPLDWTSFFRWQGGRPRLMSDGWSNGIQPRLTWDAKRGWLYVADDRNLLVLNPISMAPMAVLPKPEGDLIGYDPGTDQLYFLVQKSETLHALPVGTFSLPTPQPPRAPNSPG